MVISKKELHLKLRMMNYYCFRLRTIEDHQNEQLLKCKWLNKRTSLLGESISPDYLGKFINIVEYKV